MRRRERQRIGPRRGLSIVDVLIAIVILGILATIAYPYLRNRKAWGGGVPARLTWVVRADSSVAPGDSVEVAVRVEDGSGGVLAGIPVDFQASDGPATVAPDSVMTDKAGVAPVTWHFGTDSATVALTARVHGRPQVSAELVTTIRGAR
jgi:hypothetical protein